MPLRFESTDEFVAYYDERAPELERVLEMRVAARQTRREARRRAIRDRAPDVLTQAVGNVFGAAIIYAAALVAGVVKASPRSVVTIMALLGGLLLWAHVSTRTMLVTPEEAELAELEARRRRHEAGLDPTVWLTNSMWWRYGHVELDASDPRSYRTSEYLPKGSLGDPPPHRAVRPQLFDIE